MKKWEYGFVLIEGHPLIVGPFEGFFVSVEQWPVRPQIGELVTVPGYCGQVARVEFDWETATIYVRMK